MYTSLEQPSMAVNDSRLGKEVQMWNTRFVRETDTLANIFDNIVAVAKSAPGGKLKNLIFNCHAHPGYLQMGEGIDRVSAIIFRMLSRPKPMVDTIWLKACQVAITAPKAMFLNRKRTRHGQCGRPIHGKGKSL